MIPSHGEEGDDVTVRQPVIDLLTVPMMNNQVRLAKLVQVVRHRRLFNARRLHDVCNAEFALQQAEDDLQPGAVS